SRSGIPHADLLPQCRRRGEYRSWRVPLAGSLLTRLEVDDAPLRRNRALAGTNQAAFSASPAMQGTLERSAVVVVLVVVRAAHAAAMHLLVRVGLAEAAQAEAIVLAVAHPIPVASPAAAETLAPHAAVTQAGMMHARPQHARQHREALLLRIVEALVKRRRRIGEVLQRRAAGRHRVGATLQALDRIRRRLRLLLVARRHAALDAHLGHVAQRLLERRPVLLLIGVAAQSGMQRSDAGIRHSADVVAGRTQVVHPASATPAAPHAES